MRQFLWGALTMASATVSVFFLRYWKLSGDRLFAYFEVAFAAMGINWIGLAVFDTGVEHRQGLYVLRLAAFVLIIIGIVDKNRSSRA